MRARYLKANPLCIDCLERGQTTPASEVDHKRSLRDGGINEWSNLSACCKPCHSRRTTTYDDGFGNKRKDKSI